MLLSLIFLMAVLLEPAEASFLAGTAWEQAGREHGVDPLLLYSVTIRESARQVGQGKIKPWPYAIAINGYNISLYPQSRQEAEKILSWLISQGITNLDIGLGQVNLPSHAHRVRHWSELLDPQTNLRVAAAILKEALDSSPDPVLGVGRYHSWTTWRAAAYGRQVLGLYRRLQAYKVCAQTQAPKTAQAGTAPPLWRPVLALAAWLVPRPDLAISGLPGKQLMIRRLGGDRER